MEENIIQINDGITINVDVSVKNAMYVKNIIFGILLCNCENGKYLAIISDNLAITCDEVIESYDEETNFNEKRQRVKCKIFIFYSHFC